jgi:hypothetical protein
MGLLGAMEADLAFATRDVTKRRPCHMPTLPCETAPCQLQDAGSPSESQLYLQQLHVIGPTDYIVETHNRRQGDMEDRVSCSVPVASGM